MRNAAHFMYKQHGFGQNLAVGKCVLFCRRELLLFDFKKEKSYYFNCC